MVIQTAETTTHPKHLFIVEGPAGAGKTQLTKVLEQVYHLPVIRASLGARSFEAIDATVRSAVNDYAKLTQAMAHPDSVVVVERLFLSQAVYGTLRHQDIQRVGLTFAIERSVRRVSNDLLWRSGNTLYVGPVHIYWILLIPPPIEVERRRILANREFPWDALRECEEYRVAASNLLDPRFYTDGNNSSELWQWMQAKILQGGRDHQPRLTLEVEQRR